MVHCPKDGIVPVPEDQLPVAAARGRRVQADRRVAAGAPRGVREHHLPEVRRPGQARDRHHGHVHGLQLVLHPLPEPALRPGAGRPGAGPTLAARRPVHRRRRARRDAPAVRALLLEGDARHGHGAGRRAVPAPVQPGPDPGPGRPADVEVARERGRAGRAGRTLRRGRRSAAT